MKILCLLADSRVGTLCQLAWARLVNATESRVDAVAERDPAEATSTCYVTSITVNYGVCLAATSRLVLLRLGGSRATDIF
jgi:hypothetical protein